MFKTFTIPNADLAVMTNEQQLGAGAIPSALERLNRMRWPGAGLFGTKCSVLMVEVRKALATLDQQRAATVDRHIARDGSGNPEPVYDITPAADGKDETRVLNPSRFRIDDAAAYANDLIALMASASELRAMSITFDELNAIDCEASCKEALYPFVDWPVEGTPDEKPERKRRRKRA